MFRRIFIKKSIYALSFTYLLPGCGGDTDSIGGSPSEDNELACATNDPTISIGSDHGHTLTIPISDIDSETPGTYSITGGGHTHSISLTLADIQMLKEDGSLMKVSTTDSSHSHLITITCAG